MNTRTYRTIIQKDGNRYHGYVPALPGCHTDGATIEETQQNLTEAIEAYLETQADMQWNSPDDELIESLQTVKIPSNVQANYA